MSSRPCGTALITGASSGIGAIYADRLARRGYHLILVARSRERLNRLADRLSTLTRQTVEVLVADLNLPDGLARVETALHLDASITLLVNGAGTGIGAHTALPDSDVGRMVEMIHRNVTVPTLLSYAAAPGFVTRGRGAIINLALSASFAPAVLDGVHSGSKAYVLALCQSLHHELGRLGIQVQAVLSGTLANGDSAFELAVEQVVDAALLGFDRGELVTIPVWQDGEGWDAYGAATVGAPH